MTIKEMKRLRKESGYSFEKISELSGVPLETVLAVFGGGPGAAGNQTLKGTEKSEKPEKSLTLADHDYGRQEGGLPESAREAAPVYKVGEKKKYTIEDYYAFKDEKRRELIDGKFYVMEAPSVKHQVIIGELYILFRECARLHDKKCRVLLSPCDVQLDADRYTMVQPDLLVVCDEEKIRTRVCMGAPDLAVEIMSPSSRSRDSVLKLNKYTKAGVREFWLVDPENRTVIVYSRNDEGDGEGTYHTYSFEDTIPIGISGGACSVDFKIVDEAARGLA